MKLLSRAVAALSLLIISLASINLTSAEMSSRQMQLMVNNCLQCHANPAIDAPLMGDVAAWRPFHEKGEAAMLKNVAEGVRGMPPYGYCSACSEDDLLELMKTVAGLPAAEAK